MRSKIKTGFVFFLATVMVVFMFAACGGGNTGGGSTETTPPPAPTETNEGAAEETAAPEGSMAGQTFRLGVIFPLSGNLSKFGQEEIKGLEIRVDEINASGGINGAQVELVIADAPTADVATSEAERLCTVEKVNAIIGSYSSGVAYAASAVAEKNKVIYWEGGGVADDITERGFEYLFRITPAGGPIGETQAFMVTDIAAPELGIDPKDLKIALIYEDSAYGSSVAAGMRSSAQELGLNIVVDEGYSSATTDLSSLILKMKQAEANIVTPTFYVNDGLLLFRQMKELNYQPDAVICGANSVQDLKEVLGEEGINGLMHAEICQPFVSDTYAPGLSAYIEKYKELNDGNIPWSGHSIRTYAGSGAFFEGLRNAESWSAEDIQKAFMALDIPENTMTNGWGAKFDDSHQNTRGNYIGVVWHEGEPTAIWPDEAAWPGVEFSLPWRY